jgi:hypothetical protein
MDEQDRGPSPISSLVQVIGQAAQESWAQTARLTVLLAVAATAVALIVAISRH